MNGVIKAFESFDHDKTGVLDTAEFRRLIGIFDPSLGEMVLDALVEDADPSK